MRTKLSARLLGPVAFIGRVPLSLPPGLARALVLVAAAALACLPAVIREDVASATGTPPVTVALQGDSVTLSPTMFRAGGAITLKDFSRPQVNAGGAVAFAATSDQLPCTILRDSLAGGPSSVVAADGDEAPPPFAPQALGVCFPAGTLPSSSPLENDNGDVVFQARLATAGQWALWVRPPLAPMPVLVVREGATTPIGSTFGKPELLDANNTRVLFSATRSGVATIWRATGATIEKVVAVGDTLPGSAGTVTAIGAASMNASGTPAWAVTGSGLSGGGVYSGLMPSPTKVVAAGDLWFSGPPVGDISITAVSEPDVLDSGDVTFRAMAIAPYGAGYFTAILSGGTYTYSKRALAADPDPEGGTWGTLTSTVPAYRSTSTGEVMLDAHDGTSAEVLWVYPAYERLVGAGDASSYGPSKPIASLGGSSIGPGGWAAGGTIGGPAGGCALGVCGGIVGGGGGNEVVTDTDKDGIQDKWENSCRVPDKNNNVAFSFDLNVPPDGTCDANADRPDVFVEVDYLDCAVPADVPAGLPSDCQEDPTCSDGVDNGNNDGADTNDTDCHTDGDTGNAASYDPTLVEDGVSHSCTDGMDNGGVDFLVDGADPDCHNHKPLGGIIEGGATGVYSCEDGIDNDSNGKTDTGKDINQDGDYTDLGEYPPDPGCSVVKAFKDAPVLNPGRNEDGKGTCSDGIDNTNDGTADMGDADCHTDNNPLNGLSYDQTRDEDGKHGTCNDHIDNAVDGKADGGVDLNGDFDYNDLGENPPDPDCIGVNLHVIVDEALAHAKFLDFSSENCNNGLDDDGDGKVDNNDPNCNGGAGPKPCIDGDGKVPGDSSFEMVRAAHFGTALERPNAATIATKQWLFHYALSTDRQSPIDNNSSGCGQEPGSDFYMSLGAWKPGPEEYAGVFMHELGHNFQLCHGGTIAPGGWFFNCPDNYKPDYLSVMNYTFQFPWTPDGQATGRPLDYSRVALPPAPCVSGNLPTLDERTPPGLGLSEPMGIDCQKPAAVPSNWPNTAYTRFPFEGATNSVEDNAVAPNGGIGTCYDGMDNGGNGQIDLGQVKLPPPANGYYPADTACWNESDGADNEPVPDGLIDAADPDTQCHFVVVPAAGGIDWNNSGLVDPVPILVSAPINDPPAATPFQCNSNANGGQLTALAGYADWPSLVYNFRAAPAFGREAAGPVDPQEGGGAPPPDTDADGYHDGHDNCIRWPNPAQNLPPWVVPANDLDCDGFNAARETFMGTDATRHCPATPAANDERGPAFSEPLSPWPVDINDDRKAGLADVLSYIPVYLTTGPMPPYNRRYDLNADNKIGLADILTYIPFYLTTCTP